MSNETDDAFRGNEWEVGYSFGIQRTPWERAVTRVQEMLGRDLTEEEREELEEGWREGTEDARDFDVCRDRCPQCQSDEIPF
jgi:hypothetical protein